ncbi:MAG: NMD3-related protein [Candidatus Diapherotrites archaeon]
MRMVSSSTARFCPRCGRTDGSFIGLFCTDCYVRDHSDLVRVPPILELSTCNYCGKFRPSTQWIPWNELLVDSWIKDKIKIRDIEEPNISITRFIDEKDKKLTRVKIIVNGMIDASPVHLELETKLYIRGGICNDDMLVSSDYYEAIVQVRFEEKTNEKMKQVQQDIEDALKPVHMGDSKAVVVNWIPQKFGFDAWIVSNKGGKAAAVYVQRKYNGTFSVSGKQIGLDVHTNKTKFRNTYLVRIP